jgi:hypothetical protein
VYPYEAELWLLANSSPLAHSVYVALTHERMPVTMSEDEFLRNFASFGWDDEEDEKARELYRLFAEHQVRLADEDEWMPEGAIAGLIGSPRYRFIGQIPSQDDFPFPTNTPFPTGTPPAFLNEIGFTDLSQYFSVIRTGLEGLYWYRSLQQAQAGQLGTSITDVPRDANGQATDNEALQRLNAFTTLVNFLDRDQFRNEDGSVAWWHEDGQVTMNEIMTVIAFHEGKEGDQTALATRLAVYTRFIWFMAGEESSPTRSNITQGFDMSRDENDDPLIFHNYNLDRLIRATSYFEPWNLPARTTNVPFNFDITSAAITNSYVEKGRIVAEEVDMLFTDPSEIFIYQGESILPEGVTLENASFSQLRDLPFHFASRQYESWPGNIQELIDRYAAGDNTVVGLDVGQIAGIRSNGNGAWQVVVTVNQAADYWGGDGINVSL